MYNVQLLRGQCTNRKKYAYSLISLIYEPQTHTQMHTLITLLDPSQYDEWTRKRVLS